MKTPSPAGFREIEHTADWALRIWAPDLAGLLQVAAQGMYSLMRAVPAAAPRVQRTFTLPPAPPEDTLVDFLSELLFLHETEGLIGDRFEFQATDEGWLVTMEGAPARESAKEIKAVTYHNLEVRHTGCNLEATIVFDV